MATHQRVHVGVDRVIAISLVLLFTEYCRPHCTDGVVYELSTTTTLASLCVISITDWHGRLKHLVSARRIYAGRDHLSVLHQTHADGLPGSL